MNICNLSDIENVTWLILKMKFYYLVRCTYIYIINFDSSVEKTFLYAIVSCLVQFNICWIYRYILSIFELHAILLQAQFFFPFSVWFIHNFYKDSSYQPLKGFLPSFSVLGALALAYCTTAFSEVRYLILKSNR